MKTEKVGTSFRLTPEAVALLKKLAENMGLKPGAVLEILIRKDGRKLA